MEVVDKTWYKDLEDLDKFHTNVTALKLLGHLTRFCFGLHTVDALDIPQLMKTLFTNTNVIQEFTNAMEAAQRKSKRSKLVIQDECMHAVVLKLLLKLGECGTKTREWSKLPDDQQTWVAWKTIFQEAYVAKRWAEVAREGEYKPVGGSAVNYTHEQLHRRGHTSSAVPYPLSNQMRNLLEGYLDNIVVAATQAVAIRGPFAELSASLAILIDTVAAQQK